MIPPTPINPRRRPERDDPAVEMLNRMRRIETKMTQLLVLAGAPTEAQKPVVTYGPAAEGGKIILPSPHSSVREALDAIPSTLRGNALDIYVSNDPHPIGTITRR